MGAVFPAARKEIPAFFLTLNPALHQRRRRRKKTKKNPRCVCVCVCNVQPRCASERGKPEPRERTTLKVFVCTGMQAGTTAGLQKGRRGCAVHVGRKHTRVISSRITLACDIIVCVEVFRGGNYPCKRNHFSLPRSELAFRVGAHARTGIGGGKSEHVSVWATFPGADSRRVHYRPK